MVLGLTEIEAVGSGGGGGGGGGGGVAFFLQAPNIITAPSMTTSANHFMRRCFTLFLLRPKRLASQGSDEVYLLFPTPIRLGIAPCESQLLDLTTVRQHAPNFFLTGPARLKNKMPSIRRPGRKIVAPAIVGQLHPLLAGNIHQVKVRRARRARTILANPGKTQKLPVGCPVRGYGIPLIGHALLVGAVGFHGINLRQTRAPADKRELRIRFPVPRWRNIRLPGGRQAMQIPARGVRHINLGLAPTG